MAPKKKDGQKAGKKRGRENENEDGEESPDSDDELELKKKEMTQLKKEDKPVFVFWRILLWSRDGDGFLYFRKGMVAKKKAAKKRPRAGEEDENGEFHSDDIRVVMDDVVHGDV